MRNWALVKKQTALDPNIFLLSLEEPECARRARPGQFVMLRVSHGKDPLLARPFSIHGVQGEELQILYRVVGKGTKMLSMARPGKRLAMWGPLGRGYSLDAQRPVLVAGGLGAASLVMAAKALAGRNRRPAFLLGLAGLEGFGGMAGYLGGELERLGIGLDISSEDGSVGAKGLVTGFLRERIKDADGVLACGPMAMLKAVARQAGRAQKACQVSLEAPMACGVGACLGCAVPAAEGGYLRACQEGPVLESSRVDWGRS